MNVFLRQAAVACAASCAACGPSVEVDAGPPPATGSDAGDAGQGGMGGAGLACASAEQGWASLEPPSGNYIPGGMVWSGAELVAVGSDVPVSTPGPEELRVSLFDPSSGTWKPGSTLGSPSVRVAPAVVAVGSQIVVWGGAPPDDISYPPGGGVYDAASDQWRPMTIDGEPEPRSDWGTAISTGVEMLVWGGYAAFTWPDSDAATGGFYDPAANEWTLIADEGAPAGQASPILAWTGSKLIIARGLHGAGTDVAPVDGAIYDPGAKVWAPISADGAPSARRGGFEGAFSAWTGTHMLVWGGLYDQSQPPYSDGGLYDPATDTWTATSLDGAPTWGPDNRPPRAVWTGSRMIVLGRGDAEPIVAGGIYDPATDTWQATTTEGAPGSGFSIAHLAWDGCRVFLLGMAEQGDEYAWQMWAYQPPPLD